MQDLFFAEKKKLEQEKDDEKEELVNKKNSESEKKGKKKEDKEEKKYEADNNDEGNEKRLEEKLDGLDKEQLKRAYEKNIEFDMSYVKKQKSMKLEDKVEMERIRRWAVKIYNIYITQLKEMAHPFLQFTLGGDFKVEVYKNKSGETYKVPKGTRGYSDKTEVQENVDKLEKRAFDKIIDIEMRMSYSMIGKQKLMVEVWDYNTVFMNTIKSYTTYPMIDIVNGNKSIVLELTQKESGRKNPVPYARVEFVCLFQEIWDFKLNFLNWKCGCLIPPVKGKQKAEDKNKKLPSSRVEVALMNTPLMAGFTKVVSEEATEQE